MTVIKKLELTHFGKFSDTVIELQGGLNEFCQKNEWGKSTVVDFIIYILYGFKKTTKKDVAVEDHLYKKYLPWSDDSYIFGAMELEHDGRHIRIERRTGLTGRAKVTAYDISGGLLDITDPGVQLFKMDAQTFMRTFLVRQTDIVFDGTADIETALKNLVTTGDEQTSFDAAMKIITDKKKKYQHGDKRAGRVFELPRIIAEKKLQASMLAENEKTLSDSLLRYESESARLLAVQKTEAELEKRRTACIGNDAKKIAARAEAIMAERDGYQKKLEGATASVSDDDIKTATEVFNKREIATTYYNDAKAKMQSAQDALEKSKAQLIGVEYIEKNQEKILSQLAKKPRLNIPLMLAGIAVIAVCSVLAFVISPVFAAGVLVGAVILGISFKKISPAPILDKTNEQLSADLEKYRQATADIKLNQSAADAAKSELDRQRLLLGEAEDEVVKIQQGYGITELSELSTLLAQSKNTAMLSLHVERLNTELDSLLSGKSLDEYKELAKAADGSDLGVLELERMLAKAAEQKSECAIAISRLERERAQCVDIRDKINAQNAEIKALERELADAEYNNEVLAIARDTLSAAYEKINNDYSPIISQKIAPYLFALTGGKYSETVVDRQFNIRVKYKGEYKELGFFSRGTADSVYLAVRIAMAEILEGEGRLPLILDDPFWSLDSDRLQNAKNLMEELAKDRQIVVFYAN